jgi:hypothetical protein
METGDTRPTNGPWYILLLISLMYLITYLDRVNISTAAPDISKELGFDKITMSIISTAFAWAYAIFQLLGRRLGDRFGARTVLMTAALYRAHATGRRGCRRLSSTCRARHAVRAQTCRPRRRSQPGIDSAVGASIRAA